MDNDVITCKPITTGIYPGFCHNTEVKNMTISINAAATMHDEKLITKAIKTCITYDHSGKMENIFSIKSFFSLSQNP